MRHKLVRLVVSALCLGGLVLAACSETHTLRGEPIWQGGDVAAQASPVAVAALAAAGETFKDRTVVVTGKVTRVCQGRGCWVEVTDGGSSVIAKSLDHTVLFPKDCVGQQVRVVGRVRVNPPQSCADEGKAGHAEGAKDHECPKPTVLVEIQGAELYAADEPGS